MYKKIKFDSTGEITGELFSSEFYIKPKPDEIDIDPSVHITENHYVKNNKLLEYTPEQKLRKSQRPSFIHQWSNETFQWIDPRTDEQRVVDLKSNIDSLLVQIDSVASDVFDSRVSKLQAIYDIKEEQARAWVKKNYKPPAPSFILAESEATGQDAKIIADNIIAKADSAKAENDDILPKIESARRKWKIALPNAKDEQSATDIFQAASTELNSYRKQ